MPLISIVDDDESVRRSTERLLRSAGYQAQSFASGEALLNSDKLGEIECLILDVRMPGIDGLEIQRRLQEEDSSIPIIFITAHYDNLLRQRAMAAGAMDVFRKPFDADSFLTAVETAVRQSRSAHVSYDKLHQVAAPPMAATGYFEPNSVLTAEEAE